jgi:hypothetical protein
MQRSEIRAERLPEHGGSTLRKQACCRATKKEFVAQVRQSGADKPEA